MGDKNYLDSIDYPDGEEHFNPAYIPSAVGEDEEDYDFLYEDLEGLTNEDLF
jgi:hypothetical protein